MIMGNAADTLRVMLRGGWGDNQWAPPHDAVVLRDLPWRVYGSGTLPHLELEAGAVITFQTDLYLHGVRAHFTSHGTAADPVIVRANGSLVVFDATQAETVRHVRFHDAYVRTDAPIVFEHVTLVNSVIDLGTGSRLVDSSITGALDSLKWNDYRWSTIGRRRVGTVIMSANSELTRTRVQDTRTHGVIVVGAGASVHDCTISGNAGDGVRVEQGSVTVTNCNLENNTGVGIANLTDTAIDAPNNWWGDPAGPLGVNGDGVSGPVRIDPIRTAPFVTSAGFTSLHSWLQPRAAARAPR